MKKNKMKILHVIPYIHKKYGGPSSAIIDICKEQKRQGIIPEVATTFFKGEKIYLKGIKVHSFQTNSKRYAISFKLRKWLINNIKNYDLIHIHSIFCYSTLIASKLARKNKIPYIIRTTGQLYIYALKNKSYIIKKICIALYEKKNLKHASAIHFTANDERKNIAINLNNKKSYVLPLGVENNKNIPKRLFNQYFKELKNKNILLFLSRIHPKKGLDVLIPSLREILIKNKAWVFVIAGSGEDKYTRKLKELVKKHKLIKKVFFTGFISGDKKSALLQYSDIFILPSHSENFGIAIIEAMQAGLPVLISDKVAISENLKINNASLIFSLNKKSIENKLNHAIKNIKLRNNLSLNGQKLVKKEYNWQVITKRQITIYKKMISPTTAKK